jgi:hypothetical protein
LLSVPGLALCNHNIQRWGSVGFAPAERIQDNFLPSTLATVRVRSAAARTPSRAGQHCQTLHSMAAADRDWALLTLHLQEGRWSPAPVRPQTGEFGPGVARGSTPNGWDLPKSLEDSKPRVALPGETAHCVDSRRIVNGLPCTGLNSIRTVDISSFAELNQTGRSPSTRGPSSPRIFDPRAFNDGAASWGRCTALANYPKRCSASTLTRTGKLAWVATAQLP